MVKRRKLVSFTDTRIQAKTRVKQFKKKGFTRLVIRPEVGGFSVFAGIKRRKRR